MNDLKRADAIPPASLEISEKFKAVIEKMEKMPQVHIETKHSLHAGVYSRTIFIPKGVTIVGTQMQRATMLVQYGKGVFTDGTRVVELEGYQVLEGSKFRQCAWTSYEDTWATMYFATNAKTVEEAEKEFCSDPSQLLTNKEKLICQE